MNSANVFLCKIPATISNKICVNIEWTNHCFYIFVEYHITVTVSLGRPYARSIYCIFPLCIVSNALVKSTNKCCLKIFCMYSHLMKCQNLRNCGLISLKTVLIFPKNFLHLWSDTIEKQGIINFSSYDSYALGILSDFKITLSQERKDGSYHPFCFCVLYCIV